MASFFVLLSSFFGKIRLLASSKQRPTRRPAQGRKDGISYIDQTASMQCICLYKSMAATSKEQVFDKGMRQKFTKRVNSFIACCADCSDPLSRGRVDSEKYMRVYTSSGFMSRHEWRVDKSTARTCKNRNAC